MLALASGGRSALRSRFEREAVLAGCTPFIDRESTWVGGRFPAVATDDGARWLDDSLLILTDTKGVMLGCATPAHRSLYVYESAAVVLASSSLEHLVRVVAPALSRDGLAACVLAMGLPDRVPFAGITRIRAGETWRYDVHGTRLVEAASACAARAEPCTLHEATTMLQDAIAACVGRVCEGSDRIGIFLSGGLDSSAVLAALVEHVSSDRIVAVTWALDEHHGDRPFVDAWVQRLDLHVERITAADCAPLVANSLVLGGAPTALMTGAFERAAMRRAKSRGAKIMLTGVGGDECFSGSLQAAVIDGARTQSEIAGRALRAELPWIGTPMGRLAEMWIRPALRRWIPSRVRERNFVRRSRRELGVTTPILDRRRREAAALHVEAMQCVPLTAHERWTEMVKRPFWVEIGELRAQLEAAEQLPRFDVPLDAELHRVLATIPPRFLFDEERHRGLLRRVLQGRAPQIVAARSDKADFEAFALEMIRGAQVSAEWADLARGEALQRLGIGPVRGISDTWREPSESLEAIDILLTHWTFLTAEAFAREHM